MCFRSVWSYTLVLAVLFLSTQWGGVALAGDGSVTVSPPAEQPVPSEGPAPSEGSVPVEGPVPADRTFKDTVADIEQEMDTTHDKLEQGILRQVIRLDDFFGNVKTEELRKTRYQLRWRNSFRVEEGGAVKFGTTLRANVVLSRISDRLRLALSSEDEADQAVQGLPEDPGNPGLDRTTRNARLVSTELRYGLLKTADLDMFLGAGFRVKIPPEGFVRSRFQYTRQLSNIALLRFGETLFIKNSSGFGETTEIDLERLLGWGTFARWASSGTVSEEFSGMEWGTELSLLKELSPRSAITLGGGIYGNTSASAMVGNFKVFTRYRRNFLRSWLFYELEPEVSWPRNEAGQYLTTFAITGRIEVVFQGDAAKDRSGGGWP